jgi:hypothetical protein
MAKVKIGAVRQQCKCLTILAVLLDAPGNPNRVGSIKRRIIDDLQLAFRFVKENKVFSSKCFYDLAARWVSMVINLPLGCLCIFANLWANVLTEGDYIGEEAAIRVWVVGFTSQLLDFSKDGIIEGSSLYSYVFLFYDVVYDDPCHTVIVVEIDWGAIFPELKEHVDDHCISSSVVAYRLLLL